MPQVVLKDVIFSYVNVWEPRAAKEGQKKKYSARILIDKNNATTLELAKKAVNEAINEGIAKGLWTKAMVPSLKLPIRDGDKELEQELQKGEEHKGRMFFNANANADSPPGVVEPRGGKAVPIEEQSEFFSGCEGHAYISFYPFKTPESKGVAAGLNGCYKLREGQRLDGRAPASSVFAEFAAEDAENVPDPGFEDDAAAFV